MRLFTVTKPVGTTNAEFDAYVALLEDIGVDVSHSPRVSELGTQNRWLYAWTRPEQAERFLLELRARTTDDSWFIHEFDGEETEGPLAPLRIVRVLRGEEFVFTLAPASQARVLRRFPNARLATKTSIKLSVPPTVANDFEQFHGPLEPQIAMVLTGLKEEQIEQLGGYQVVDQMGAELFNSNG